MKKETATERLERFVREGIPKPPPGWETNPRQPGETMWEWVDRLWAMAEPLPPKADVIPLQPWGPRRPWTAEPAGTVNSVAVAPNDLDYLVQLQRANAAAARADRLARDPFGLGLYGHESLDDLVRRQNGDD
jgi:hypothetical protein